MVLSRECRGSAPAPAVILNPVKGAASKMDSDGLIGLHNTTPRPGASRAVGRILKLKVDRLIDNICGNVLRFAFCVLGR